MCEPNEKKCNSYKPVLSKKASEPVYVLLQPFVCLDKEMNDLSTWIDASGDFFWHYELSTKCDLKCQAIPIVEEANQRSSRLILSDEAQNLLQGILFS